MEKLLKLCDELDELRHLYWAGHLSREHVFDVSVPIAMSAITLLEKMTAQAITLACETNAVAARIVEILKMQRGVPEDYSI